MESTAPQINLSVEEDDDEWDTDGFVIPSLEIEDPYKRNIALQKAEDSQLSSVQVRNEESIYLGPHGAPPSQAKQQEQNVTNRKQKFKHKLKEADKRHIGSGRENKIDNLKDLVGAGKMTAIVSKSSPRDWLDPHCHESEFEKRRLS